MWKSLLQLITSLKTMATLIMPFCIITTSTIKYKLCYCIMSKHYKFTGQPSQSSVTMSQSFYTHSENSTQTWTKCSTTQLPWQTQGWDFPSFTFSALNLSTHLKHQIRRRLMSQPPPSGCVVLGDRTLISYMLAQTEKELCGAEMLLLLAKPIHLHATFSLWQFHNKSSQKPTEARQQADALPCPRLSV